MSCLQSLLAVLLISSVSAADDMPSSPARSPRETTITACSSNSYRLPTNLKPYHYDLRLQPHIYGNDPDEFFFEGSVTIFFTCISTTSVITLHQDGLTINSYSITVKNVMNPGASLPVADVTEEQQFHFYKIHMRQPLASGQDYHVTFHHFRRKMRTSQQGLYFKSYRDGDQAVYLAATKMQPTYCRQVFPSFDEPAMKATFNVTLVRRTDTGRNYITLSNMPIVDHVTNCSWTEDIFQKTMKMPTYLLALVVCDFPHLSNFSTKYPAVETRTFAKSGRIEDARILHEETVAALDWLNDHFSPNYETYLSKADFVAVPGLSGNALDNLGLNMFNERLLYYPLYQAADRAWAVFTPHNELTHTWFGNMVTPKWWTWLWLTEGFAEYWGAYALEELRPDWATNSVEHTVWNAFKVMIVDGENSSHPLDRPVKTPQEINGQFDRVARSKGSAMVRMMHMIMGEHFIPALKMYLREHLLGNVEDRDLFESLNKYINSAPGIELNMTRIMDPWVTQMGYPVVNVERHDNQLILTQKRFLMGSAPANDTGKYGYKFEIPITYTSSSEKNFHKSGTDVHWLPVDGSPLTITLPSENEDWAVVNLRHSGYYRVNYNVTMWRVLIAQLNANHTAIDKVNRATLIEDAYNLYKADLLPLEIVLQTLNFLKNETTYGPWRAFANVMMEIRLLIESTDLFADFKRFMLDTVEEPLKSGVNLDPLTNPPGDIYARRLISIYAYIFEHPTLVSQAASMVSDWRNCHPNAIIPDMRVQFYCAAALNGSRDVWDFLYDKYRDESNGLEKYYLRNGLACSKDPAVLHRYLSMTLSDDLVPARDQMPTVLSEVGYYHYGRDVAVNFLWDNFALLRQYFSAGQMGSMLSEVTKPFHNQGHMDKLQCLRDTHDVSGMENSLNEIEERTVANGKWITKHYPVIKNWLENR